MTVAPELLSALPILEAVFHRRSYDQASSFSYHNHILQGPFLRYLLKPLKPKNIGSFRFSLVQGKNNGKLSGIRLHSSSEVTATSVLIDGGVFPTNYLINVSGVDPHGNEAKWQLAMPSEEVQRQWLDALKKACEFGEKDSSGGECENLRDLAKKMKEGVGVRRRIHLFKLFPRCFVGRMAVRWIKKELNCTVSQAVAVGNKMVSYGLFHHVTHSHIFSDDKLLYRFSVEIDPLAIDSTAVDEVFLRGDAEATKLMDTLRKGNQELKATRSALSITQVKYDDLLELWESASLNFDELQQSMRYVDYSFMAAQVLILLVVVAYYYFDNSNLVNALLTVAIALAIHVNVILGRGFGIFFSLKTSRPHENIALPALAESPEYTSDNEFEGEGDGVEGDLSFDNYEYDTEDDDEAMGDLDADDPSTPNAVGWQGMATGSGSVLGANSYPSTRRSRGYSWSGGNLSSDQGLAMAEKLSNNPILVRRCPRMLRSDLGEEQRAALSQPLPIHTVDPNHAIIDIDSDLFVGKAYMVVADVPGAPAAFFRGKRRKFEVVIQGRFKRLTPFSSVYTGQVYDEPLHQLANQWSVVRASLQILSILQPANRVCLKGAMPYVLSPLASTAQNIVVSRPGQEPAIHRRGSPLVEEDMRILGAKFVNPNSKRRKAYFSKRNNLQNYSFDPSLVYTFDFYQHMINLSTFQVDLGFMKYDIIRAIGPRPVQIMALCWDPVAAGTARPSEWPFLYNIEVWHRRALQGNTSEDTDSSKKKKN